MSASISLPLWLAALVFLLAAGLVLDRMLLPSVRWFLRRRVNKVLNEINARLHLKIQPFKLTKRQVLIDRLIFDPEVLAAVEERAAADGTPREALMADVGRWSREIVPAFNAYVYFRLGYWLARKLAQLLYRVRLGYADERGLGEVDPDASVVFVMNHRSNMDYILVAYAAASRTALSYAVGEWARIWPLRALIRSMGAYFIRRSSGDPTYRRVLERYVAMATEAGVVQAVYPEGGLSRDGKLRPPRLGLLSYMLKARLGEGGQQSRDLVFIPVGLNYDRVLEDRSLLRSLDAEASRRSAGGAVATTLGFIGRNIWQMLRGRWYRFGYACVSFGTPLSLRAFAAERGIEFSNLDEEQRRRHVEDLGEILMQAVGRVVPVLPVALVAHVFVEAGGEAISELELKSRSFALMSELEGRGIESYVPRGDEDYAITVGLRMLVLRHLVVEEAGHFRVGAADRAMLEYYANSIAHHFATPSE